MLFTSLDYILFLPIVFLTYWLTSGTVRKVVLLAASYLFYMSWMPVYGFLIFGLTAVNFILGLLIEKNRQSKLLFSLALVIDLGTLAYYKYAAFLLSNVLCALHQIAQFVPLVHVPQETPALNIILPLGISFFTFEFIHYLVDVRKGDRALKSPLDFGLFAAFFPSQLAGPIKRYQQFQKQLCAEKKPNHQDIIQGLGLIVQGLFKKSALADNLARITSSGVGDVHNLATGDAWILMFAFLLQIYFDFSGYTDMGIGSARLLGFHLPINFNLPLVASKNFIEFWRRWHISLSTWMRDYIFIPLGGSRVDTWKTYRNVLITFSLSGLWHGAAWQFVVWGTVHGILVVASYEQQRLIKRFPRLGAFHSQSWTLPAACLGTFILSLFAWTFFLAHSVTDAMTIVQRMLLPHSGTLGLVQMFAESPVVVSLAIYCLYGLIFVDIPWLSQLRFSKLRCFVIASPARQLALFVCIFIAAIAFSPALTVPFIYFQF
jgi:alginate O-acetyltransferase complex protein AlgI